MPENLKPEKFKIKTRINAKYTCYDTKNISIKQDHLMLHDKIKSRHTYMFLCVITSKYCKSSKDFWNTGTSFKHLYHLTKTRFYKDWYLHCYMFIIFLLFALLFRIKRNENDKFLASNLSALTKQLLHKQLRQFERVCYKKKEIRYSINFIWDLWSRGNQLREVSTRTSFANDSKACTYTSFILESVITNFASLWRT